MQHRWVWHAQISWGKLSRVGIKRWNSWKFSPSKVFRYMVCTCACYLISCGCSSQRMSWCTWPNTIEIVDHWTSCTVSVVWLLSLSWLCYNLQYRSHIHSIYRPNWSLHARPCLLTLGCALVRYLGAVAPRSRVLYWPLASTYSTLMS